MIALIAVVFALSIPNARKNDRVVPVTRSDTFAKRFGDQVPQAVTRVRTISILRTQVLEPAFDVAGVMQIAPPAPAPVAQAKPVEVKQAYRPRDVCERHGMHKVMVSKYRWRCRR